MFTEVIGPSGVGKSTILKAAMRLTSSGRHWFFSDDVDSDLGSILKRLGREDVRFSTDFTLPDDFIGGCISIVNASPIRGSQKLMALQMLNSTLQRYVALQYLDKTRMVVHDEMLLHRGFAVLAHSSNPEKDVAWYYNTVPVPNSVIMLQASNESIFLRIKSREEVVNTYRYKTDEQLVALIAKFSRMYEIARKTLIARGVNVQVVSAEGSAEEVAQAINDKLLAFTKDSDSAEVDNEKQLLLDRLITESQSFRVHTGRHQLKTTNVAYCAFRVPGFEVPRAIAQRDAETRIRQFGLALSDWSGSSVLDLGSNNGAMLLQLSGYGIESGYGVEYDQEKVDLARDIATYGNIGNLTFDQGDIDALEAEKLGQFDIVLALAIEKHLAEPDKLYPLLGKVTRKVLCFEGNAGCCIEAVTEKLHNAGFSSVEYMGFCTDDVRPSNNKRPVLIARK